MERRFERDTRQFSDEPSQNPNPSEARAEARPKTIEVVAGKNGYDIVMEKRQPESSASSIQAGRSLYTKNCLPCHGENGLPDKSKAIRSRYNMANLSDPMQYKYGADGRGIFRSIAFGTKAPPHGTWNGILTDQQIWNLVDYLQSIQTS